MVYFVLLVLAAAASRASAADEQHGQLAGAFANSSTHGAGALPAAPYRDQGRRLLQTAFKQLRPMSDTTQCLQATALSHSSPLQLAPCAAVPEQNFSLPEAGQVFHMYVGPVAAGWVLDLFNFSTSPGAPVLVGGGCCCYGVRSSASVPAAVDL
jgi:hypothetical protein